MKAEPPFRIFSPFCLGFHPAFLLPTAKKSLPSGLHPLSAVAPPLGGPRVAVEKRVLDEKKNLCGILYILKASINIGVATSRCSFRVFTPSTWGCYLSTRPSPTGLNGLLLLLQLCFLGLFVHLPRGQLFLQVSRPPQCQPMDRLGGCWGPWFCLLGDYKVKKELLGLLLYRKSECLAIGLWIEDLLDFFDSDLFCCLTLDLCDFRLGMCP